MTEKSKMLSGELYNPNDPVLVSERHPSRIHGQKINQLSYDSKKERKLLFH